MTDKKTKSNEGTPAETVAEVVDTPASAVIEGAQEGEQTIEPAAETVEEIIEEHTPPANPPQRGIDELFAYIDQAEDRIVKKVVALVKPEPKQEEQTDGKPTEPTAQTKEGTPAKDKPGRKRIAIFRRK